MCVDLTRVLLLVRLRGWTDALGCQKIRMSALFASASQASQASPARSPNTTPKLPKLDARTQSGELSLEEV